MNGRYILQKMDPQMRKLLEVSWEAWTDSGIDVSKLRGSNRVGVYIGCCGSEVLLTNPFMSPTIGIPPRVWKGFLS